MIVAISIKVVHSIAEAILGVGASYYPDPQMTRGLSTGKPCE
jgi:hypothetical protein